MNCCFERKHYCTHVKKWDQLDTALGPYLLGGLAQNEAIHLYSDRWTLAQFIEKIPATLAEKESFIEASKKGQFHVYPAADVYLVDGYFHIEDRVQAAQNILQETLDKGFSGLRVACEMQWVEKALNENILDLLVTYEAQVESVFKSGQLTALCIYCEESLSPNFCFRNFHAHTQLHVIESSKEKILTNPLMLLNDNPKDHLTNLHIWVSHLKSQGLNWMSRVDSADKEAFKSEIYHDLSRYIDGDDFSEKGLPDLFLEISTMMENSLRF